MLIRKEHAIALFDLLKHEREREREDIYYNITPEREPVFQELEFQNLAELYNPLEYGLTYWGRALVTIL